MYLDSARPEFVLFFFQIETSADSTVKIRQKTHLCHRMLMSTTVAQLFRPDSRSRARAGACGACRSVSWIFEGWNEFRGEKICFFFFVRLVVVVVLMVQKFDVFKSS